MSPGKPSRSRLSKTTTHTPEMYDFFWHSCARPDTDYFQIHELPVTLLCPPRRSVSLRNRSRRDICTIPPFQIAPRVDFVKDLYLEELNVYKPVPKVPRPMSSPVPQPQHSLATSYFFLGCQCPHWFRKRILGSRSIPDPRPSTRRPRIRIREYDSTEPVSTPSTTTVDPGRVAPGTTIADAFLSFLGANFPKGGGSP